ncbi:hypothetical protein ASG35_00810 [Burkholderia sp. Leaf177]|nr:hypothetical protein ASG35_00810 [Burkholderia sp. Leaf177]
MYRQACIEQKGLATVFARKREKLGKIPSVLMDKAYAEVTMAGGGNWEEKQRTLQGTSQSCLDTTWQGKREGAQDHGALHAMIVMH